MKKKNVILSFKDIEMGNNDCVRGIVKINDMSKLINTEGNRPISPKAFKDVKSSVGLYGLNSCPIAIKKGNMFEIIDGWHRIRVAISLNSTITIIIVEPPCDPNELMIALDTTMNNWTPNDFLNNGIEYHKNKDYLYLKELKEDTGVTVIALYKILAYDKTDKANKEAFEKGSWSMTTKALGVKTIKYAEELKDYMYFSMTSDFIRGFVKCVNKKGYNQAHMVRQAKRYPQHLHRFKNPTEYVDMINKVYNHCTLEEDQVYLG